MIDADQTTQLARNWLKDYIDQIAPQLNLVIKDKEVLSSLLNLPRRVQLDGEGQVVRGERELRLLEFGSAGHSVPALHLSTQLSKFVEEQFALELTNMLL